MLRHHAKGFASSRKYSESESYEETIACKCKPLAVRNIPQLV